MNASLSHRLLTAVVVCSLLFQSCQSGMRAITEEERPTPADHLQDAGEALSSGALAPIRADARVSGASPSELVSAVVPASPSFFAGPFTASSGERVLLRQQQGQWQAVLQGGAGAVVHGRTLPVVGAGDIGRLLSSLQGQDVWSSRSRLHVLAAPHMPSTPCVYVGKLGLLGGAPKSQASSLSPAEEWISGPTMILGSDEEGKKETYHIPEGYRYKSYRLKADSVVQRARLTINYVAANNEEEYRRLEAAQNGHAAAASLGANVGQVVNLGKIEGSMGQSAFAGHEGHDLKRTKHAGLVLYGSTKKDKMFRPKSMINVQVEILVEKVEETSSTHLQSSSFSSGAGQEDTKPAAQDPSSSPARHRREDEARRAAEARAALAEKQLAEARAKLAEEALAAERVRILKEQEEVAERARLAKEKQLAESRAKLAEEELSRERMRIAKEQEEAEARAKLLKEQEEAEGQAQAVKEQEARNLLKKKLADPGCVLGESESITLLTQCVSDGVENAKQILDKEAVIVIGNTGAGKSTFVNYLLGCEMTQKTPKELGITGVKKVVVVKSKSEGGHCDEVMPIGHNKTSKTFMPQIALDSRNPTLAYCDCPGFLDNRGAEINIANAVNIKRALQSAKCVKVLILINYHSLLADRGRGLTDMLNICTQLFGSTANLERFRDALLLGVTQVTSDVDLDSLREWLLDDTPKIMQVLSQRLFLYDPLNRGGSDFWTQKQCASALVGLRCIPQSLSCSMFQTVLTAEDEQRLIEIVEKQSKVLKKELVRGSYSQAGTCWQALQRLSVIDNIRVERMLHLIRLRLQHDTSKRVAQFRDCVVHYNFEEAQHHLGAMRVLCSHFDKDDLEIDLAELGRHYAFFQKKQSREHEQERRYQEERERYAAETKQLIEVIESQKQEMEFRLSALLSEHTQETSNLRVEMIRRGEDYDDQIRKLREESAAALRKQEEEQSLAQALSEGEREQLRAAQAKLQCEYEERLAAAEREKASFRSEYDVLLAQQEKAQKQSQLALQAQIAQLEEQRAVKKAELSQTTLPSQAFGAKAWSQYFGEVGVEPSLPADINTTLNAACPFWPEKQVKDTHLLILIPAKVNGKPYSLNLLSELIQRPKGGGHTTRYRDYGNDTQKQFGTQSPGRSYWVLMTRDVLEGSRDKTYADQKALVAGHAKRTKLPYKLPGALEAATAILSHHVRSGERLYTDSPYTYTRCRELVDGKYPVVVGGFSSGGLHVSYSYSLDYDYGYGVAGFRKF